ncbi:protocadherin delta 1 [Mytilus galloprovincialis]|uniref:Protocadherin-20 n=1 Tax=Mytilus galloprovincialis TaxID=29158 RepID=A0A8B6ESW9_MYTGA|nr:protocadherin delta 1 [Mytilus galloprovincialis]
MEKILIIGFMFLPTLQSLVYYIDEESGSNKFLGNIATDTNLEKLVNNSDDFKTIQYSFLTQGHPHSSKFKINETTSEIRTKENLDRETICEYSPSCVLSLQVSAKSTYGIFFETFDISVHLNDINDNTPYFPSSSVNLSVSEASLVGTKFTISSAIDKDSTNFSVIDYQISPLGSPFNVEFSKNLDGQTTTVWLKVIRTLDREVKDSYKIQILAKDGGNPAKIGTLDVNLVVDDVNDESPKFSKSLYNVTLAEDVVINSTIVTVSATDSDSGKNGEVSYRFSASQNQDILSTFSINTKTGDIKLIKKLQYEPSESYKMIVEAVDNGDQPSVSQVFVHVNILDSGNNPPTININLLSDSDMAEVSEFANMGAVVAHVKVDDGDTGRNGIVTCQIQNNFFQLQRMEVKEYKVIVHQPLDREAKPEHLVSVFCSDVGSPPLNSSKNFVVQVIDENDQPPVFMKTTYTASIAENNNFNDVILHVSASDRDIGVNAEVTYRLHTDSGQDFTIDSETGLIRANNTFDREKIDQYKFRVLAVDKGKQPLSSTCTVIVNIDDVNDNDPKFDKDVYNARVLENLKDFNVTSLHATDQDTDVNGIITYSLAKSSVGVPFQVMPYGTIKTTKLLNREDQDRYAFMVVAFDHGNPPRTSTVNVIVDVDDQNDYHPIIMYPNATNDTVLVSYQSPVNSVVTKIKAFDPDLGPNSDLLFSIKSRNDSDIFNIISTTGEVVVVQRMTILNMNLKYFLEIAVSDKGLPTSLTSTRKLYIVVSLRNITSASPIAQEQQDYSIAIAITVVVVTIVLAATIIITIFVIRRLDKQKRMYQETVVPDQNKNLFSSSSDKGSLYSLPDDRSSSQHTEYNPSHDANSVASQNTYQRPQSVADISHDESRDKIGGYSRPISPNSDVRQSELTRLASIRLHQQFAQSHDKPWTNQHSEHPVRRPGDNHSDTSGETIPSDSGRGSLDDDHHNMSKSHQSEDFRKYLLHPTGQQGRRGTPPHKQNISNPSHIPFTVNKLGPSTPHKQTNISSPRDPPNHPFYENINPHHQNRHIPYTGRDHISYGHFQKGLHQRPYLDETMDSVNTGYDDDDNTTTSGSYTIDADDFPTEVKFDKIQDVIV